MEIDESREPKYTLLDVTGDGKAELIVYAKPGISSIYGVKDGKILVLFSTDIDTTCSILSDNTIVSGSALLIPDAKLYIFGILISNIHNAWMRMVAGRMKSDYQYSASNVYNTFPWPEPSDEQKRKIEQTAQGILDARKLYPNSSLADLYDPLLMPAELRKAHTENDRAVMKAYGFDIKLSEADCVAELMKMYQKLVEKK